MAHRLHGARSMMDRSRARNPPGRRAQPKVPIAPGGARLVPTLTRVLLSYDRLCNRESMSLARTCCWIIPRGREPLVRRAPHEPDARLCSPDSPHGVDRLRRTMSSRLSCHVRGDGRPGSLATELGPLGVCRPAGVRMARADADGLHRVRRAPFDFPVGRRGSCRYGTRYEDLRGLGDGRPGAADGRHRDVRSHSPLTID